LESTSGVSASDDPGEATAALVWQPTLTLWQPDKSTPIVVDSVAPRAHAQAQSPADTATTDTATVTQDERPIRQSDAPAEIDRRNTRSGDSSLRRSLSGYIVFNSVIAASLSRLPWEEWANFAVVGGFFALIMLHLGAASLFLRAVWRTTLCSSGQPRSAAWCGIARGASLILLVATLY